MPRLMRAECCALVPGLVSVVLPVYNGASLLEGAIRSVLGQTYQDLELIIVNDGSTDGVEAVLARYSAQSKVRMFTQPNLSLPRALTQGFARARGEFWTWTSADNLMDRNQLARMVAKLDAEPDLGMTYSDYRVIDDRGNPLADRAWRTHNRPAPETGEVRLPRTTERLNVIPDNFIGPCFLYRGWIGRLLGAYDAAQGVEDYDYWMRINAHFSIRHLGADDLLYWYRVHANTLSAKARENATAEKVSALMLDEQSRALHNASPLAFEVDSASAAWLAARGIAPGVGAVTTTGDLSTVQRVAIATANSVEITALRPDVGEAVPLVLIFAHDSELPYDMAALLDRPRVMAVASDPDTAARIRAVSTSPVLDGEASTLLAAIKAFAYDRSFCRRTQMASASAAALTVPFVDFARRPRLALQFDGAIHPGGSDSLMELSLALKGKGFDHVIVLRGDGAGDAAHANGFTLGVDPRGNALTEETYTAWLIEMQIDLVSAHGTALGAKPAASAGISFVQTLSAIDGKSTSEAAACYRVAADSVSAYACESLAVAKHADRIMGLDPRKMRMIGNRIDGDAHDHGDFATAYARLFHLLLRR